ncbi:MAG: hypothetical protein ACU0BB_16915 [Paracoccaceae bacterium]
MNVSSYIFALTLVAGTADAQSMIDQLCEPGHVSEIAAQGDVTSNPDGYYVRSLQTQLSHGDLRIIPAVGTVYHLCTRPAATPEMGTTKAMLLEDDRVIKYLFVPVKGCPKTVS